MAMTPTFAVASREKIPGYISEGLLKYPSYVLCKTTYEWVYIDKNLEMHDIKGYAQASMFVVDVLPEEDFVENAFYLCDGIGYLSINGKLVPVFKDISDSVESYNDLADVPVINKVGTMGVEIILSDLDDGTYSVKGNYKIGGNMNTVYIASANTIILVESDDNYKYITKLGAKKINVYTFDVSTSEVVSTDYATESWVSEQGYTTQKYVDEAIEALYQRIANEALVTITKVSQLENDIGYLVADDLKEIDNNDIADLFLI